MRNARKLMPFAALSTCAVAVAAALSLAALLAIGVTGWMLARRRAAGWETE